MDDRIRELERHDAHVAERAPMRFALRNDPPGRPDAEPAGPELDQRRLFDGMDCLPGQMDLFG